MLGRVRAGAARHGGMHDERHAQAENHLFDKTRMCRFFAKGRCARGLACTFAHSEDELEARPDFFRTQLCPAFLGGGICPLGSACTFAHSPEELRRPALHASHPPAGAAAPRRGAQREEARYAEEAHQLELMQQQIARLREQLRELEVLKVGLGASGGGAAASSSGCSSRDEELAGVCCPAGHFSRQTTAEGEDSEGLRSAPLSPRSCDDDDNTWEDLPAAVAAPEPEAPEPCALVVRRTFFSLEPVRPEGPRRRSKSAPAAAAPRPGGAAGEALQ